MGSIAQRLRYLREASGLGPKALALTCGLASSHVHMIEAGTVQRPDLATLQKIADTTGVPVSWLAFGEGQCPAPEAIAAVAGAANAARRARMAEARGSASDIATDLDTLEDLTPSTPPEVAA